MEEIQRNVIKFLTEYGFQIIGAIIILVAGGLVARWLGRVADQWFLKMHVEPPIRILSVRAIRLLVFLLAVVLALDKCGVPITPMVAGIGVAGVGVGLATQGVLANMFAGLTIIFTKPFRVGEYIELLGVEGQVASIELFSTTLHHVDRSRVVIPNRKIIGEILHNYGTMRQVDLSVGVAYGTDLGQATAVIREVLARNPRVLKDPPPVVGVVLLDDSSVNIAVKPWVQVADFGAASSEINQGLLEEFHARNINMPFPQREVRILKDSDEAAAG
jgi:small conductance mechanosensitive channel